MPTLLPEMGLLRAAMHHLLDAPPTRPPLAPLCAQVNWQHVLWLGRQHEVLSLLHETLLRTDCAGRCPPEIFAQLTDYRTVHQHRSLARAREICRLQDLFDDAKIPAVFMDRWLSGQLAHPLPHLQEFESSLLMLVRAEHLPRATDLLTSTNHPLVIDPEQLIRHDQMPVLLNAGIGRQPQAARLHESAATVTIGGRTIRHLGLVHSAIVQGAHLQKAGFILGHAIAVALLVARLGTELPAVLAESARFGRETDLRTGLIASHKLLGLPVPDPVHAGRAIAGPEAFSVSPPPLKFAVAPFLPTPPAVIHRMLTLAEPGPDDLLCDLGCGDGRIVTTAALKFGTRGRGVDRDPARILEANTKATAHGVHNLVSFDCGDLFDAHIADATIIVCYLLPQLQPPLLEKLRREARPGTRIVSHNYIFPDWPPEKTEIIRTGPIKTSQIYLWRLS